MRGQIAPEGKVCYNKSQISCCAIFSRRGGAAAARGNGRERGWEKSGKSVCCRLLPPPRWRRFCAPRPAAAGKRRAGGGAFGQDQRPGRRRKWRRPGRRAGFRRRNWERTIPCPSPRAQYARMAVRFIAAQRGADPETLLREYGLDDPAAESPFSDTADPDILLAEKARHRQGRQRRHLPPGGGISPGPRPR